MIRSSVRADASGRFGSSRWTVVRIGAEQRRRIALALHDDVHAAERELPVAEEERRLGVAHERRVLHAGDDADDLKDRMLPASAIAPIGPMTESAT